MFSNSAKYAMKAVLYLALHSDESKRIAVKNMSVNINVPKAYLSKILQALSRHDLVSSSKGPHGGFYLSEGNRREPIGKIVNIIDGKKRLETCLLSLEDCNAETPCPLHGLFVPARTKLIKSLEHKTIEDLSKDLKNKKAFLPL
ncbi:Rrf2 family transcriptional regulator [Maribacter sp.]|nr:Rrf2 family transcriptional regulator [Maribacter sp.]